MRLSWRLTGRAEEMRLIDTALSASDCSGIVICGAAGVGKSRLAQEVLAAAADDGYETHWAAATSAARALPLGALSPFVASGVTDTLAVVRGVVDALTASPTGKALVGVDDVHLLDDLSAFVLHQVVARKAAKLMLTIRNGSELPAAVGELFGAGYFDRLDLQPLSRSETADLLGSTLGGSISSDAVRRLWTLSGGNTLYLRNIVEQEVADGRLLCRDDAWVWTGDPVIPPGLVEMIESRIGSLPRDVSDVVDALAVGEPIPLASLVRITNAAAVEEAEQRGLVTLDADAHQPRVRVAHPLYGEVRRARAGPVRLRRLRGRVATELAVSGEQDMQMVVRCAALSLDSDLDVDVDLFVKAAHGAVWTWDMPLADRLADAATRAGGGAKACVIHAYALSCMGRGKDADALLATADRPGLDAGERATVTFLRATNMLFTLADPEGAKAVVDAATPDADPAAQAYLDAFCAVYWAAMGRPLVAADFVGRFGWEQLHAPIVARVTAWALTVVASDTGRVDDAVVAAERGYPVPIRSYVIIADAHVTALLLAGRIAEAEGPAAVMRAHQTNFPRFRSLQLGTFVTARAELGAGRLDSAARRLESAGDIVLENDEQNGWRYRSQIPRVTALAMLGFAQAAEEALARLDTFRHPSWQFLDYEYAIATAWVSASRGAISEAVATVRDAAARASANGQLAPEVMCLQIAVQWGDASCAARLAELRELVAGPRAGVAAAFAAALQAGDGKRLAEVSEEFERMGDLVAAVDAASHAAIAYRRNELRGSALVCSARADALALRCGGAVTPALRQASERLPLTTREREIVSLLAQGMTSAAIAQRLTLSSRTVEGHIYRAMAKTGTTSRSQLAALLVRQPGSG